MFAIFFVTFLFFLDFVIYWPQMYRQWVPCHCNFSYNFKPVFLKLHMFSPGSAEVHMGWIWFYFNFYHFFHFNFVIFLTSDFFPHYELSHFSPSIYRQWVPREHDSSYNFIPIFLNLWTCFLHSLKMCISFSYNPCLNFCHFSNLALLRMK